MSEDQVRKNCVWSSKSNLDVKNLRQADLLSPGIVLVFWYELLHDITIKPGEFCNGGWVKK